MKKVFKRSKHNNKFGKGRWITFCHLNASDMNPIIMQLGIEIYADHTCGIPHSPIDCNCYFIDLTEIALQYKNRWLVPLSIAHRFVDDGMRVFIDNSGVIVASTLNADDFNIRFQRIVEEANAFCNAAGR